MKKEQNYISDIAEIRSMMERSSKFLTLSGWAGIMAGIYALSGVFIGYYFFNFYPDKISYSPPSGLTELIFLAVIILMLAIGTAVFLSYKKSNKNNEKIWNATLRRLIANMAVPLAAGGLLILILLSKGLIGLIAPLMLLFYGLSLFSTSSLTYDEVKFLGLIQIALGLLSLLFIEYSLIFWALGFGIVHIVYGIYMYFRYER